jgi:hypothetical protein
MSLTLNFTTLSDLSFELCCVECTLRCGSNLLHVNEWLRAQIGICIVGVRVARVCVCVYGCVYGCFVVFLFGVMCFVNGVFGVCRLCFCMLLHMSQCSELLSSCVYMCCVCVYGYFSEFLSNCVYVCCVCVYGIFCVCVYGCVYGCFVVFLFDVMCFVIMCNVLCEWCVWCMWAVFFYVVAYGSVL